MSLYIDKSAWKRVRLGDVIARSKKQVDPMVAGVDRYVAGGHFDSGSPTIERWGDVNDGQMGSTFRYAFRQGQVLFLSARPYLRKVGVPAFDGVVADKTYVLDAIPENGLSQEYLPFILLSDVFCNFAVAEATGSMNPRLLWGAMQRFEFDLPPLDEQKRIANLLWATERHQRALAAQQRALSDASAIWSEAALDHLGPDMAISQVIDPMRPICYGVVQPGDASDAGVPLLRVLDLEGNGPQENRLKHVSEEVDRQYRRSRVVSGDVLVSIVGTIGRCWVVAPEFGGANIARALARLAPNPDIIRSEYLFWLLTSPRYERILTSAAFESARKTLNLSVLANLRIPVPPLNEQDDLINRHFKSREALSLVTREREAVQSIRGTLLREVGEVR